MLGVVLQGLYVVNVETSTSKQEWTIPRVPNRVLLSRHPDQNLLVPTTPSNNFLNLFHFFFPFQGLYFWNSAQFPHSTSAARFLLVGDMTFGVCTHPFIFFCVTSCLFVALDVEKLVNIS